MVLCSNNSGRFLPLPCHASMVPSKAWRSMRVALSVRGPRADHRLELAQLLVGADGLSLHRQVLHAASFSMSYFSASRVGISHRTSSASSSSCSSNARDIKPTSREKSGSETSRRVRSRTRS